LSCAGAEREREEDGFLGRRAKRLREASAVAVERRRRRRRRLFSLHPLARATDTHAHIINLSSFSSL
jgi:hypothetical protein